MTVSNTRVAIVGGGLAGVYAAYLLEQRGITDYVLLEARPALGGRIQSLSPQGRDFALATTRADRFDLGPTWYWPAFQAELDQLVQALGLERFVQHESGDMVLERSPNEKPVRSFGYGTSPPSMRLRGGMAALVEALHGSLKAGRTVVGQKVLAVRLAGRHVDVVSRDAAGALSTLRAEQVLLAVPPRLAHASITFSPPLPTPIARKWQHTATWMAPHAKYVAVYDTPFWREAGLSGEARSGRGPLGEIHDASMPGGSAALFGFFAVPAAVRRGVAQEVLIGHCRAQFARLFGPQAAAPKAEFIKDWALDELTATATDQEAVDGHASPPPATIADGDWRGSLVGVGSEWSPQFPGYVAGAIEAARLGVQAILAEQPAAT